ncbi:MAG TPA: hypothetical protein VGD17_09090, partial [Chitinophagaceae bacterium]
LLNSGCFDINQLSAMQNGPLSKKQIRYQAANDCNGETHGDFFLLGVHEKFKIQNVKVKNMGFWKLLYFFVCKIRRGCPETTSSYELSDLSS